jgi:hypothetical protein
MPNAMADAWAVYRTPVKNCPEGRRGVCEQGEWEAMDRAKPGFFTLVQGHIGNEGEAERLARGTAGAASTRSSRARLNSWPGESPTASAEATGSTAG